MESQTRRRFVKISASNSLDATVEAVLIKIAMLAIMV